MRADGVNLGRYDIGKGAFWGHKREVDGYGNSSARRAASRLERRAESLASPRDEA